MLTVDYIVKFGSDFIPVYLNFLHDCKHIGDVHPRRRSRAEFGLVLFRIRFRANKSLGYAQ